MKLFLEKFKAKPNQIFFIDGLGALLTAILLYTVLRNFNTYFEMPKNILDILTIIALVFSVYSFCCFFLVKKDLYYFLLTIIIANFLYGILTIGLVIFNYSEITILGIAYFSIEMLVIYALVLFEIKVLALFKAATTEIKPREK